MRPLTKFLLIILISLLLVSYRGFAASRDTVNSEGPKFKSFFFYKTPKKFLGATVEIISAEGNVITSTLLQKRKLVIDFGHVQLGEYIIRVSKGEARQEFVYIKKE
jgi:hypothetical protein